MSILAGLKKNFALVILSIIIISGFAYYISTQLDDDQSEKDLRDLTKPITNFVECKDIGGIVQGQSPSECLWNGDKFVEDFEPEKISEFGIKLDNLYNNKAITSPLILTGTVDTSWVFEGDFPVSVLDNNKNPILEHYATVEGEWMQPGQVKFTTTLNFDEKHLTSGFILLRNNNPSGLKSNAIIVEVPILFAKNNWKDYTNQYYPSLKISYSADWKLSTSLKEKLQTKDEKNPLYSREIVLTKDNSKITIKTTPLTAPVGFASDSQEIQGVETSSQFYRYFDNGVYYYKQAQITPADLIAGSPSTALIPTTLKAKEFYAFDYNEDKENLEAMVYITYQGDEKNLPSVEEILNRSRF